MTILMHASTRLIPFHMLCLAAAVGLAALLASPGAAHAQPDPQIRKAVRGDSVYVYHTKRLPSGHGFNVYRQEDGTFKRVNEAPIRGIQRASQLPAVLGPRYDWLAERYEEDTPAGVYYTMRSDWTNGLFAAFLDPAIARALGLLFVDHSAPMGETATYRIAFVDAQGTPTGETLTQTVSLEPTPAPTPEGLDATNEGRSVTLSWNYSSNTRADDDKVIRFDVYRLTGPDDAERVNGRDVILRNSAKTTFSYDFTVPRTGREETFFVAAVDITGVAAALSDRLTYRVVDNKPPAPVNGLEVYTSESEQAQLTWSVPAAPDVAGYHVYRAPRLEAEFQRINDTRLDRLTTSYVDSTVTGRRTYHYGVAAVDSAGNEGAMSRAVMAQVMDYEPPPAPRNLTAAFDTTGAAPAVQLDWSVDRIPPDLQTYRVLRRRQGGPAAAPTYAQANDAPVRTTTFSDQSGDEGVRLAEGAFYRYAVVALDSARNASDTTFARLQIPDRTPPDPPSQVRALNEDGIRAVVRWGNAPALDVTAYRVYRQKGAGPDSLWQTVAQDTNHLPDDAVQPGQRYRYTVSAVDSLGNEGPRSDPATLDMRDFSPPAAVRNVQAQAQPQGGVRVRWEAVSAEDVAGYRVYRTAGTPTGVYAPVHGEPISDTTFTDPNGAPDMWYRVRAIDTSGNESTPSEPARALPASGE